MRDIKFRAWDEGKKMMHLDFEFIRSGINGDDWVVFKSDKQPLNSKPHPLENPFFNQQLKIMQYTGLKDKNDKEIYEGDIVKTKYQKMAKIVWDNENTCFATETVDKVVKDERMYCLKDIEEIIGNVCDNPELLK